MNYNIPLGADETIEHELHGVTYLLRPCTGRIERKISAIQGQIFDVYSQIPKATALVDGENIDKKWKQGERTALIFQRASRLAEDNFMLNYSAETEANRRDEIFNIICKGWNGNCVTLADNTEPSDYVRSDVKQNIVEWYMSTQVKLSGEEQKN